MKKEVWKKGNQIDCVVTDDAPFEDDPDTQKYYGGKYLVAESIGRVKDVHLISAAPDLLECLQEAVKAMPKKKWKAAIDKALGDKPLKPKVFQEE